MLKKWLSDNAAALIGLVSFGAWLWVWVTYPAYGEEILIAGLAFWGFWLALSVGAWLSLRRKGR